MCCGSTHSPDIVTEQVKSVLIIFARDIASAVRVVDLKVRHNAKQNGRAVDFNNGPLRITVKKCFTCHINSLKIGSPSMIFNVCISSSIFVNGNKKYCNSNGIEMSILPLSFPGQKTSYF
jgi:hypothetical protein